MQIKPFKPLYPDLEKIINLEEQILALKEDFGQVTRSGLFKKLKEESYIIHTILSPEINCTGLICLTHIDEYIKGNILKHENTIEEKEHQQLKMFTTREAIIKPALLTYPNNERFDDYIETLKSDKTKILETYFNDRQQTHIMWAISAKDAIENINKFFNRELLHAYIADGHHRFSTYAKYSKSKEAAISPWILTVYIPFSGLKIFEFNRLFISDKKIKITQLIKQLDPYCFYEELDHFSLPKFKFNFIVFDKKHIYACVWKPSILEKYEEPDTLLDVSLLNEIIFDQILEVNNVRTEDQIKYVEGYRGWEAMLKYLDKYEHVIGFYLYPVNKTDFQYVSDNNKILPPKSTWFEPRVRNGLIIHEFKDDK